MLRLTPPSGRDRESPHGDASITGRSSTVHDEDQNPRDMSVADHYTPDPVCGRETPVRRKDMAADLSIQTCNTQNNNKISETSICTSPRKLSSKAYIPTPYSRPVTPVSLIEPVDLIATAGEEEIELDNPFIGDIHSEAKLVDIIAARSKEEIALDNPLVPHIPAEAKPVDVIAAISEEKIEVDNSFVAHTPPKVTRYFSPVPYHKRSGSFSPVNWQSPVDVGVHESDDVIAASPKLTDHEDVDTKRPPQMPTSNDLCVGSVPVPLAPATDFQTSVDMEQFMADRVNELKDRKSMSESRNCPTESAFAAPRHMSSDVDIKLENEIKMKEDRRKKLLMNMKSYQNPQNPCKQNEADRNLCETPTRRAKQTKQTKSAKAMRAKKSIKDKPPSEDGEEMHQLKKLFDEHLKEKEKFDEMIEKREEDIEEQIREMDEILDSMKSEQSEVEHIAGEFADTMKTYTNFRDEATRARVHHVEQEISSDIVFEENESIKEQVRELYDETSEIKERRDAGIDGLVKDSEEMKYTAEMLREKNEEDEVEVKSKVEEFNRLKMDMMDRGISYVTKRKPVQKSDIETPFPKARASRSPPLKPAGMNIDNCDVDNVSPDIATPRLKQSFENDEMTKGVSEEKMAFNKSINFETETYKTVESYRNTDAEGNQERCTSWTGDSLQSAKSPNIIDFEKKNGNDIGNEDKTQLRQREPAEPKRQMSVKEQTRLTEVRKKNCRIPKPVIQPYGSATRDGDRFVVSKSNSRLMIQSDGYKRDAFVPEDQRHFTKPTMDFLDLDTELRRLRKKPSAMIGGRENGLRNRNAMLEYERKDIVNDRYPNKEKQIEHFEEKPKTIKRKRKEVKAKIDTGLKNRPNNMAACRPVNEKEIEHFEEKPKTTKRKRKEVKAKIDTGFKNRPNNMAACRPVNAVAVTDTSLVTHKKDTQRRQNECRKATGKKKSCVKAKEFELPPLKNTQRTTKDTNDMPMSSNSFGNKTPLPNIKSASRQRKNERPQLPPIKPKSQINSASWQTGSNYRDTSRFNAPLPPISKAESRQPDLSLTVTRTSQRTKARARRLPPIVSAHSQSSNKQKPEAMWISLSPSPPPANERTRKRTGRAQNSSRQSDKKRVSSGRA